MNKRQLLRIVGAMLSIFLSGSVIAQETRGPVVRIAELEIDPAQLENYTAVVKEEMETSIRVEPGVLALP